MKKVDEISAKLVKLKPATIKVLNLAVHNTTIVSGPTVTRLSGESESRVTGTLSALTQSWLKRVGTTPDGKAEFALKEDIDRNSLKAALEPFYSSPYLGQVSPEKQVRYEPVRSEPGVPTQPKQESPFDNAGAIPLDQMKVK